MANYKGAQATVTLEVEGERLAAHLFGELDHHSVQPLRQEIDRAATAAQTRQLILDFSGVTFMDSSGIGLVMGRYQLAQQLGAQLSLVGLNSSLRRVMQIAGMDKLARF